MVPPGGASYYDDNEWVGIELARLYKLHHEAAMLEKAEQIMAFVMAGWQSNPKLACPGGVPFSDSPSNTERNTVTDGPAAELGVQLYRLTGDATYLQFAEQAYEWVRTCLRSPSELYYDHIRLHGVIDTTLWSYNQGSMIGAGVLLYQVTGNGAYLYQARQTAKAALAYFTIPRLALGKPVLPVGLLPQPDVPRLGHARPTGPEARPGIRQQRLGPPAPERQPVRVRLAAVHAAARSSGGRADLCAAVHAGQHVLLIGMSPARVGFWHPRSDTMASRRVRRRYLATSRLGGR